MRSRDTSPAARAAQLAVYRSMSPSQRLEAALSMSDEVMELTKTGIRMRRPGISDEDVIRELHRILGHHLPA